MREQRQDLDELIVKLRARERATWRTSLLWIIVPALLGFAFLGYASVRLADANKEVAALQEQADTYRAEVKHLQGQADKHRRDVEGLRQETTELRQQVNRFQIQAKRVRAEAAQSRERIEAMQSEITTLHEKLQETLELSKFEHPVDMVDMKMLASRHPDATLILDKILELRSRGVGWHLHGETPEEGFDSPGFAAFVLEQFGLLPREANESLLSASRQLAKRLESTSDPKVGDLALYPAGYVLFRFEDRDRKPFVIGMTPVGIVSLKPNFDRVIGYRKPR